MTAGRTQRSVSPSLPSLSRASTPASSAPPTPVLSSSFPSSSKMAVKPSVGFAYPATTSAYRTAAWDELSVMRAFASHATHCDSCCDPERLVRDGRSLCRTGTELAKDIGKYFYCWDGKPYSTIDRKHKSEKVQVEVPVDYAVIKVLFESLSKGLRFASLKQRRPEIHQSKSAPSSTRAPTTETYELKTASSANPKRRSTQVYNGQSLVVPEYETRTPYDTKYREASPPTTEKVHRSSSRREPKRGSLYPEERRSKRRSTYVLPFSSGWLG